MIAQTFVVNSTIGYIYLNESYINIPPFGVKRIKIQHTSDQMDMYSWSWIYKDSEYHFENDHPKVFLVRTSLRTKNILETIRIIKLI